MGSQNQLTMKGTVIFLILTGLMLSPLSIEPIGFDSPYTQDIEFFIQSQFNEHEQHMFSRQEKELFIELIREAKNHPDLVENLPVELATEVKVWLKSGKSL